METAAQEKLIPALNSRDKMKMIIDERKLATYEIQELFGLDSIHADFSRSVVKIACTEALF